MISGISIENFKSIESLSIDGLSRGRVISISGPPNSGKTAVGEAIGWALTNNSPRVQLVRDIIRVGSDGCQVTLDFNDGSKIVNFITRQRHRRSVILPPGGSNHTQNDAEAAPRPAQAEIRPIQVHIDAASIVLRHERGHLNTFINWIPVQRGAFMAMLLGFRVYRALSIRAKDNVEWREVELKKKLAWRPILEDKVRELRKMISPIEIRKQQYENAVENGYEGAQFRLDKLMQDRADLYAAIDKAANNVKNLNDQINDARYILWHARLLLRIYRKDVRIASASVILPQLNKYTAYYLMRMLVENNSAWAWHRRKMGKPMPDFIYPPYLGEADRFCTGLAITLAFGHVVPGLPGILFLDIQRELSGLEDIVLRHIGAMLKEVAKHRCSVIVVADERASDLMDIPKARQIGLKNAPKTYRMSNTRIIKRRRELEAQYDAKGGH